MKKFLTLLLILSTSMVMGCDDEFTPFPESADAYRLKLVSSEHTTQVEVSFSYDDSYLASLEALENNENTELTMFRHLNNNASLEGLSLEEKIARIKTTALRSIHYQLKNDQGELGNIVKPPCEYLAEQEAFEGAARFFGPEPIGPNTVKCIFALPNQLIEDGGFAEVKLMAEVSWRVKTFDEEGNSSSPLSETTRHTPWLSADDAEENLFGAHGAVNNVAVSGALNAAQEGVEMDSFADAANNNGGFQAEAEFANGGPQAQAQGAFERVLRNTPVARGIAAVQEHLDRICEQIGGCDGVNRGGDMRPGGAAPGGDGEGAAGDGDGAAVPAEGEEPAPVIGPAHNLFPPEIGDYSWNYVEEGELKRFFVSFISMHDDLEVLEFQVENMGMRLTDANGRGGIAHDTCMLFDEVRDQPQVTCGFLEDAFMDYETMRLEVGDFLSIELLFVDAEPQADGGDDGDGDNNGGGNGAEPPAGGNGGNPVAQGPPAAPGNGAGNNGNGAGNNANGANPNCSSKFVSSNGGNSGNNNSFAAPSCKGGGNGGNGSGNGNGNGNKNRSSGSGGTCTLTPGSNVNPAGFLLLLIMSIGFVTIRRKIN